MGLDRDWVGGGMEELSGVGMKGRVGRSVVVVSRGCILICHKT